jgi:hypothetical protein
MALPKLTPQEMAPLGDAAYGRIKAAFRPEDEGKFVAIDVDSDDFEISEDDYTAVKRLSERRPDARIWLAGVGRRAAHKLGGAW